MPKATSSGVAHTPFRSAIEYLVHIESLLADLDHFVDVERAEKRLGFGTLGASINGVCKELHGSRQFFHLDSENQVLRQQALVQSTNDDLSEEIKSIKQETAQAQIKSKMRQVDRSRFGTHRDVGPQHEHHELTSRAGSEQSRRDGILSKPIDSASRYLLLDSPNQLTKLPKS